MNTLEITDIIDVYYDGRKPFSELPKAPVEDEKTSKGARSQPRRAPISEAVGRLSRR